MRINISVAMTIMAKASHATPNSSEATAHDNGNLTTTETEFGWNSKTQELLIAAFWIGFTTIQIPAGYLADRLGGKWLIACGVSLSGIFNLLGPIAARSIGLVWAVSWIVLVYEDPSLHPCISGEERNYIEKNRFTVMGVSNRVRPPFGSMLTSLPVVALLVCMFTATGVVYLGLNTNLPLYLKHVIGFDIMAVGFLSSLPYLCHWLMLQISSHVSDSLIGRKLLSRTATRKLMVDVGAVITAGGLILVCTWVSARPHVTVILMTIAAGGMGVSFSTAFVNAIDLAPSFSGTLMGIANSIAVSAGFIAPLAVGALTEDQTDPRGWHIVFYGIVAVDIFGAMFFHAFGSGDVQEWAVVAEEEIVNDVTQRNHDVRDREAPIAQSTIVAFHSREV
ncbi:putative inorganic phosphate cotransporter [Diadema antillarum]|uniref:putative inorganic phosphate cotransporter n=1 Tax=Diadema antillarum TaxID=105358 RepID=UPI003A86F763